MKEFFSAGALGSKEPVDIIDGEEDVLEAAPIKGEKKLAFDIGDEENVSEAERREVTEKAIKIFHDILSGVKDYAVIASTALYLHGQEDKIEKLQQIIPGDFDAAVFFQAAMDKIVERLSRNKNVIFFNRETKELIVSGNPLQTMPDREAKVLSGSVAVTIGEPGQETIINYPFEFFYKTRVVPDSLRFLTVSKMGFPVLALGTALREQYRLNFKLEGRLDVAVQKVWRFLVENKEDILSSEEKKKMVAKRFELKPSEIDLFFNLLTELDKVKKTKTKDEIHQRIVDLLSGGFKSRAEKRWRTLGLIDEISSYELEDK